MNDQRSENALLPRVWAPLARRVTLHRVPPIPATGTATATATGSLPADPASGHDSAGPATPHNNGMLAALKPSGDGWWSSDEALSHGSDYAYSIDDGAPLPDPRSAWQPNGVDHFSRTFDTALHDWADQDWAGRDARNAVIYEMHIGTFTAEGTLDSAIARLDYLADLGVDMVELMPVAACPGEHNWGYDGVGLYAVQHSYGGPAALQRFVDAAHQRGLAVCLDVVYNHVGPSGNYLGHFGPYFHDKHSTPWGPAVNLDGEHSAGVRHWIIDNACRWFSEFHMDALRLDAVHALIDDSDRHLLAELADTVCSLAMTLERPLSLIAESDLNQASMVTPTADGGQGMTAQWADDVHHALHTTVTGERHGYYCDFGSLPTLAQAMTEVFVHNGSYSSFRGQNWGSPVPRDMDGHRFVVFASNHDQVGNRALGDRPSQTLTPGQLAISASLVLCSPFTPMIFMGEEWGASTPWQFFTDHQDENVAEATRRGRMSEFGDHGWEQLYGGPVDVPDPQARSTFLNSKLDWRERESDPHRSVLNWYKAMIALRKQEPTIRDGSLSSVAAQYCEESQWFIMERGVLYVAMSLSSTAVSIPLEGVEKADMILAWDAENTALEQETDGSLSLTMPGHAVAVLRVVKSGGHS